MHSKIIQLLVLPLMIAAGVVVTTPATASTMSLSTAPWAEFTGEAIDDNAGYSISAAGDFNGDGYKDMLIGAPYNDDAGVVDDDMGAVYIIYGSSTPTSTLDLSDPSVTELTGYSNGDLAGASVASGDIDGDGYDDVLIGAPENDDNGSGAGAVYLLYGQSSHLTSGSLSGAVKFTGEAAGDLLGVERALASDDIDGDGYDDILVGAPTNDDAGSSAGAVYIIYGSDSHLTSSSVATAPEFTGEAAGDLAGIAVSSGDLNNDGYGDILVGAAYSGDSAVNGGSAYILYGQASQFTATTNLSTAIEFTGEAGGDVGWPLASGDLNGDGYDDVLIGGDENNASAGAVFLVYGQSTQLSSSSVSTTIEFTGEVGDAAGWSLATGDMNQDGYDDILIGAPTNDDAANNAGATYLIPGQASELSGGNLSTFTEFTGEASGDRAGVAVATGDVNNDGYDDAMVGANETSDGTGSLYLLIATPLTMTIIGDSPQTVECTSIFTDDGATATDGYTSLPLGTSLVANPDTAILGVATITYTAIADSLGFISTIDRTITVSDTTDPIITLTGDAEQTINQGDAFTDPGATVDDACDTSLTTVTTTGSVDTDTPGTYTLTYTATDASDNAATPVTRTVTVVSTETDSDPETSLTISSITKSGAQLTLQFADDSTSTITPFPGQKSVRYTLSVNDKRLLVTNGKVLKVYVDGNLVERKVIGKKKLKKKFYKLVDKKLYKKKSYDTVVVMRSFKTTEKMTVLRLNTDSQLNKIVKKKFAIKRRTPITFKAKPKKHRFITTIGKDTNAVKRIWKLKTNGKVVRVK